MLPKKGRLERKLFQNLLSSRNYANSEHFSLRYAESPDNKPHFGVSVSKKVSKSAVSRNSVRRRVYSSIAPLLPAVRPNLYLFVAKPKALDLKGEALAKEIKSLLKDARSIV